jgi:hypothetical protein
MKIEGSLSNSSFLNTEYWNAVLARPSDKNVQF